MEGDAISSWDTHRDGGARWVGSIARRGQWCQWPSPALGSEKSEHVSYVRPLALVGILWNSLHNQTACLDFNSNHTYKSPGIHCGFFGTAYIRIKRLPVSTSQVTSRQQRREKREANKWCEFLAKGILWPPPAISWGNWLWHLPLSIFPDAEFKPN